VGVGVFGETFVMYAEGEGTMVVEMDHDDFAPRRMRWSHNVQDFVPEAELDWYESVSHAKAIQKFRAWREAGCPIEKDDEDNAPKRSSPMLRWVGTVRSLLTTRNDCFASAIRADGRNPLAGARSIPGIDLEDSEPE
jgi:hypothetical protein